MAQSEGFKRAAGLAIAQENILNSKYAKDKKFYGKRFVPTQRVKYIAGSTGMIMKSFGKGAGDVIDDVVCFFKVGLNKWFCSAIPSESKYLLYVQLHFFDSETGYLEVLWNVEEDSLIDSILSNRVSLTPLLDIAQQQYTSINTREINTREDEFLDAWTVDDTTPYSPYTPVDFNMWKSLTYGFDGVTFVPTDVGKGKIADPTFTIIRSNLSPDPGLPSLSMSASIEIGYTPDFWIVPFGLTSYQNTFITSYPRVLSKYRNLSSNNKVFSYIMINVNSINDITINRISVRQPDAFSEIVAVDEEVRFASGRTFDRSRSWESVSRSTFDPDHPLYDDYLPLPEGKLVGNIVKGGDLGTVYPENAKATMYQGGANAAESIHIFVEESQKQNVAFNSPPGTTKERSLGRGEDNSKLGMRTPDNDPIDINRVETNTYHINITTTVDPENSDISTWDQLPNLNTYIRQQFGDSMFLALRNIKIFGT